MALRKELTTLKKSECARLTAELETVERQLCQLYELEAAAFKEKKTAASGKINLRENEVSASRLSRNFKERKRRHE